MDVALQAPALLVLRGHQALTRGSQVLQTQKQLFGQADVPKDQAGARGDVFRQVLLGRGEPFARQFG